MYAYAFYPVMPLLLMSLKNGKSLEQMLYEKNILVTLTLNFNKIIKVHTLGPLYGYLKELNVACFQKGKV